MSMTFIQRVTLPSAQQSLEFTSIPNTFTDLFIQIALRSTHSSQIVDGNLTFNGTSANLTGRLLYGDGSSRASASYTAIRFWHPGSTATSSTFSNMSVYIPNYAASTAKSVSIDNTAENNATFAWQAIFAGLWNDNSPITSIRFTDINANLAQGSTATLYGITRGSNGGVTVS